MRVGLDIGSTTIKCVVLDEKSRIVFSTYQRHYSHIYEKAEEILTEINRQTVRNEPVLLAVSGSAGMGLAARAGIPFVQEVFATGIAAGKWDPGTDCVIELGGEDAKILYLSNGREVRMNGSCAGGTGAFIDQMAALLKLRPEELDRFALEAKRTYAIASRCGVFAKSDIQPLINQGADIRDIAASIYQAVVNQTVGGLSQGRKIKGNILYLGGPLAFSECLRRRFDETLNVSGLCPEHALLYVAMGAAAYADQQVFLSDAVERIKMGKNQKSYAGMEPLFSSAEEYAEFAERHGRAAVERGSFDPHHPRVHIGIDSGSTTVKLAVINEKGQLLYTWYKPNNGHPVPLLKEQLEYIYHTYPEMEIASVTTTGYGEDLVRHAFRCDSGIVETIAHFTAAGHFLPDVDFIIDIGGQDMKCFKISQGAISDIFLNEACSSGCGSFLQTFAQALGYDVKDFSELGLFADQPVDLGSRCTVFMNSSVKQAQKDGATIANISAGLSISIVKNALYKVIRCSSPEELGSHIVVQGGTFYNESVLRAFEKEMGIHVIRPDIAGLMGAYGAALYGLQHTEQSHKSTVLDVQQLRSFEQKTVSSICRGCGNQCLLTVNLFSDGHRLISGNRCDKPVTGRMSRDELNLYAFKQNLLAEYRKDETEDGKRSIGIPFCLNMYELLPFWYRLFHQLGFRVIVSPVSSHALYQKGQETIPSDTVCYPAKLVHGHIAYLVEEGVDTIFYPCMSYNLDEKKGDNHYNCPIVAYYPEVISDNCFGERQTRFLKPYVDLAVQKEFRKRFPALLQQAYPGLDTASIRAAIDSAYAEYALYRERIKKQADVIISEARREKKRIIILAGRPYHADPEINHGIDQLLIQQGAAVITEDSVCDRVDKFEVSVLNQWTYHSRLYAAARYCTSQQDMNLIQLVSFGCGLDAITTDETRDILQKENKLYTQLKIDEITNLGTVRIRIRSLFAALDERDGNPGGKRNGGNIQ